MKRIVAAVCALAACLALCACGGSQPAETYKLEDTVSTDLVEITPNDVQFAIALESSKPFGSDVTAADDHFLQPKEYDAEDDAKNPYVASKGNVIVAVELTLNNLDRNYLELDESGKDLFTIEYGGKIYKRSDCVEAVWCEPAEKVSNVPTVTNILLDNEGPEVRRGYFEFPFEPESLADSFTITFNLPSSDGKTATFTYEV